MRLEDLERRQRDQSGSYCYSLTQEQKWLWLGLKALEMERSGWIQGMFRSWSPEMKSWDDVWQVRERKYQEWALGSRLVQIHRGGTIIQMRDPGRRPSLGGKIMNSILDILNARCFWQSRGSVKSTFICPGQAISKASHLKTWCSRWKSSTIT